MPIGDVRARVRRAVVGKGSAFCTYQSPITLVWGPVLRIRNSVAAAAGKTNWGKKIGEDNHVRICNHCVVVLRKVQGEALISVVFAEQAGVGSRWRGRSAVTAAVRSMMGTKMLLAMVKITS